MRVKKGTVSSTKQDKTIVVTIHTYKNHPIYKKRYRSTRKYHVHNPDNKEFKVGDEITFYETRPISKLKRWTIVKPENTEQVKTEQPTIETK